MYILALATVPSSPGIIFIAGFAAHLDAVKERGILVYYSHTPTVMVLFDSSFCWQMLESDTAKWQHQRHGGAMICIREDTIQGEEVHY